MMEANPPRRFSVSQLPADADPAEREFVGLLAKALAPSYTLIRRLGAGGMGTVYVARDPVLRRLVAVKVMSPELSRDPDARTRFSREAQAVAALSHPNVVAVYAVGELENGLPYIVMQYVEGRSMSERVAEDGPLDVATAKRVLGEVASALSATHKKGIIHRDIKPANILWDDESGRALVTDFGIAAIRERPDERGRDATKITQTGMAVGTPAYMSPEQFLAEPVTEKTDIYALGLLGYELLLGEGPYAVKSPAELMVAHLRDEPRRLSTLRSDVDSELEALMGRCLAKDPTVRPTAQYVADHLTHGAGMLLEWPPPGLEDFSRRYNSAVLALTIGGLVIGVPLVGLSTMDLGDTLRQALPSAGALAVLTFLGFLALIVGASGLFGLFWRARHAVARGYGWITVFEATCDERGDAGALIAGGREYAALSPEERNMLRTRRMVAGGMRLAGALMPLVGYVAGLVIAVRFGAGETWLVLLSLFASVLLLILARAAVWSEEWRLRKSRARLSQARKTRADDARLGDGWTTAFDAVRAGQRLGAGHPNGVIRHAFVQYAIAALAAVFIGGACGLAYAMAAIGSVSELTFDSFGGVQGTSLERLRKIRRLDRLRLPVDSSITPLRAGEILRSASAKAVSWWTGATEQRYLRQARQLSAAMRDSLRVLASEPQLAAFRTFARARSYDYLGSAMPLAKLDSLNISAVPLPKYGPIRSLGGANFAAGVVAMSEGKYAEAELRFRELLSAGFLLIDESGWLIDALVGRTMVLRARTGLAGLYQQTGRSAEASFVAEASDPPDATTPEQRQLRLDQRQARVSALRILDDTMMIRGMRMEVLFYPLAYGPCGDLKQVVFGVDPIHTAALARARKDLVRFPSDSVVLDKITHALDRPMIDGFGDGGLVYRLLRPIARIVDFLTGSKRMQSCVSMLS